MKTNFSLIRTGHLLITSTLLFFFLHSSAQITITQADMPDAGDTLRVSYSYDTIDATLTGANYLWDYSFLTPYAQWVEKFDAPANFPPAFFAFFNPLNASYGQEIYMPDSIWNINPDNAYSVFKETSTQQRQIGVGLTINSLPVPIQYNPDDIIYRFPLQYGNTDSSDAEFGFQIPPTGGPYYGQFIHRVNEADGWGTLLTPFGTFQSLRIKSTITVRDTFADTLGNGYSNTRAPRYEFKWLTQGGKIPYMQADANDIFGIPVVTQITYRDSMRDVFQIGVNEITNNDLPFAIYPNPTSGVFQMQLVRQKDGLSQSGATGNWQLASSQKQVASIEICNVYGEKVYEMDDGRWMTAHGNTSTINHSAFQDGIRLSADQPLTINLDAPSGIYFVKISSGKFSACRKFVVMR